MIRFTVVCFVLVCLGIGNAQITCDNTRTSFRIAMDCEIANNLGDDSKNIGFDDTLTRAEGGSFSLYKYPTNPGPAATVSKLDNSDFYSSYPNPGGSFGWVTAADTQQLPLVLVSASDQYTSAPFLKTNQVLVHADDSNLLVIEYILPTTGLPQTFTLRPSLGRAQSCSGFYGYSFFTSSTQMLTGFTPPVDGSIRPGGTAADSRSNVINTQNYIPAPFILNLQGTNTDQKYFYFVMSIGTTGPTPSCNGAKLNINIQGGALAGGDPLFLGLHGQRFTFPGIADQDFHLFSDPFISVNSRFEVANPLTKTGTIMKTIDIVVANHTLHLRADDFSNKTVIVKLDQKSVAVDKGKHLDIKDSCVDLSFDGASFWLESESHKIQIQRKDGHDDHIEGAFLDIRVQVPLERADAMGGIIGQTGSKNAISKDNGLFIVKDGKTRTYRFKGASMCSELADQ